MKTVRKRKESGAAMVEMALVTPLLLILVLGIIEFGWLFGQFNDIRHAVRETARYAAVSNPNRVGDPEVEQEDLEDLACSALSIPTGAAVELSVQSLGSGDVGDSGTVTITAEIPSLTNAPIVSLFLPDDLANSAEFRIEQEIQWASFTTTLSC